VKFECIACGQRHADPAKLAAQRATAAADYSRA
jgi:hypothetical protein